MLAVTPSPRPHCSPAVVCWAPVKSVAEANSVVLQVQVAVPVDPLIDCQVGSGQRQGPHKQVAADEQAGQLPGHSKDRRHRKRAKAQ